MKKTVCLILVLLFCVLAASCGKKEEKKTPEINLEYYAKFGEIPEVPCKLGTDPKTLKSELSKTDEESETTDGDTKTGENAYMVTEGEETVSIQNGIYVFCYGKDREDKGISYIVDFSTAYGFEQGTIISQIKKKLDPYPYTERKASQDELFAMFGEVDRDILEYRFDNRTLLFVFEENALVATILYDTTLWDY